MWEASPGVLLGRGSLGRGLTLPVPASSQDDSAAGLVREPQTGGGCSCAEGEAVGRAWAGWPLP